jgi:hypothetical protein
MLKSGLSSRSAGRIVDMRPAVSSILLPSVVSRNTALKAAPALVLNAPLYVGSSAHARLSFMVQVQKVA